MKSHQKLLLSFCLILISSCKQDPIIKTQHDINFFIKNASERKEMILNCNNEYEKYKDEQNCINALKAERKLIFDDWNQIYKS